MSSPRALLLLPVVVAAAVALGGCVGIDPGPTTSQTRDPGAFTRVRAGDAVDVEVRAGAPRSLRVRAGEKVIDDIRTEVRDGTLRIWYDGPGVRRGPLAVDVSAPEVEAIAIHDAADVRATGFHGRALDARIDGSGDLEAAGRVGRLTLTVDGAGDADLAALAAGAATVDLRGAGDAEIRATRRLDANVSGAGDLSYHGDPAVRRRVTGAGDLRHAP